MVVEGDMFRVVFQLKLQAEDAERTRRGLERARQEVVHHVTLLSAEKNFLEREVTLLTHNFQLLKFSFFRGALI